MIQAIDASNVDETEYDLVIVPVIKHTSPANYELLDDFISSGDFEADLGNTFEYITSERAGKVCCPEDVDRQESPITRYVMVGVGSSYSELTVEGIGKIASAILKHTSPKNVKTVFIDLFNVASMSHAKRNELFSGLAQKITEGSYEYTATKKVVEDAKDDIEYTIGVYKEFLDDAIHEVGGGVDIGNGVNVTKLLGDLPSNICTPTYLADFAMEDIHGHIGVEILDENDIQNIGMGSMYSVSKGSDEEGKVIIMEYNNAPEGTRPIVLVGKAVTFDSGGISIKPSAKMDEMKYDMCGGATVIGVMDAIANLGLPVNVIGLVGAVENMPSARASKPGDIVTSLSGKTIEIGNTDAEGRLVLCDLLTYAGEYYDPKVVIDMATLTGACCVALGDHATGLFTPDDALADALIDAGEASHDRCWRLPVWDEYNKQMDSTVADVSNMGSPGAGASTAACFLGRFAADYEYSWAHLDIAGTAWSKMATGRPVSMLVEYIKGTY